MSRQNIARSQGSSELPPRFLLSPAPLFPLQYRSGEDLFPSVGCPHREHIWEGPVVKGSSTSHYLVRREALTPSPVLWPLIVYLLLMIGVSELLGGRDKTPELGPPSLPSRRNWTCRGRSWALWSFRLSGACAKRRGRQRMEACTLWDMGEY